MTPENFCYWLRGYLEISGSTSITDEQLKEISNHLDLVFTKLTPSISHTYLPSNLHTSLVCTTDIERASEYYMITPGHTC